MSKNVPYDVAMSIPDEECLAYMVIMAGFDGGEFDWDRMRWKERKP